MDDQNLTSGEKLTGATSTPGDGTTTTDGATGDASPQKDMVERHRYDGASSEAVRQKQRADMLQQQLFNAQQTAVQTAAVQSVSASTDTITDKQYADAVISGDEGTMRSFREQNERSRDEREQKRREAASESEQAVQAASYALQQAATPIQKDPALANQLWERYQQYRVDPSKRLRVRSIEKEVPGYGKIDLNMMTLAAEDIQREQGLNEAVARETARRTDTSGYSVPATEGSLTPSTQSTGKFNPDIHLSEDERAGVQKAINGGLYKDVESYWNAMDPDVKKARLAEGRPIRALQLGKKEVIFSKKT